MMADRQTMTTSRTAITPDSTPVFDSETEQLNADIIKSSFCH